MNERITAYEKKKKKELIPSHADRWEGVREIIDGENQMKSSSFGGTGNYTALT